MPGSKCEILCPKAVPDNIDRASIVANTSFIHADTSFNTDATSSKCSCSKRELEELKCSNPHRHTQPA
eukprot:7384385-Prymnesium_polylepis.1